MSIIFPAEYRPGRAGCRCAVAAAGLIAGICGLHVYWALGGGWAADTLNGGSGVPPKGVIWVAGVLFAAAAMMLLGRVGIGGLEGSPTVCCMLGRG